MIMMIMLPVAHLPPLRRAKSRAHLTARRRGPHHAHGAVHYGHISPNTVGVVACPDTNGHLHQTANGMAGAGPRLHVCAL